ncbi:MAG: glyoxylate reductase [Spirochaetaceae bacterium]|nr:MAG: glyoxylate reductase [Spirochaetaceae bacterium]
MNPKILFTCKIADSDVRARLAAVCDLVEIEITKPAELAERVGDCEGIIVPYTPEPLITREVMDAAPRLRLVGTTYGGVRQNVDDTYALSKGLTVIHTGASRVEPMAEYTLALILSSLMQTHNYHHYMRSGEAWPRTKFPRTRMLRGRSVGVIGYGRIGQGIIERLRSFTADLSVQSNHLTEAEAQAAGLKKRALDDLFRECEVIVLAGGYNPSTHHLIRRRHFDLMRENALFVNIARGKMVNEAEMTDAVRERPIYLALDVFEVEPLPANSPLRENDRVLITPHRANNPIEFEQRWQTLAGEIETFIRGETPDSALSPERAAVMSES